MEISEDNRHNVASISDNGTGIENVIIWIGCKIGDIPVIKVSNNPEDLTGSDVFSIDLINYNILGKVNTQFIKKDTLDKIKMFIDKNKSHIVKYTNEEIFTDELVDELVKFDN